MVGPLLGQQNGAFYDAERLNEEESGLQLTDPAQDSSSQDEEEDRAPNVFLRVSPASSESDDDSMGEYGD